MTEHPVGTRRARRAAENAASGGGAITGPISAITGSITLPRRTPDQRPRGAAQWARWALLPVGVALLFGWVATSFLPLGSNPLLATPHVVLASAAPLVTVAAIPLVAKAAQHHRWLSLLAAVVAAIVPWNFVLGYASASDRLPAADTTAVRVLLINAHQGRVAARDVVSAVVANRVDLLVVTELTGTLSHELTKNGLDGVLTARYAEVPQLDQPTAPAEAGIGVWSTATVDDAREVPGVLWPAMTGRVSNADLAFTLVVGHVAPPQARGALQWAHDLRALRDPAADAARTGPTVVMANLNASPWHADFRAWSGTGLVDAADALGQGLRPTWPTWSPVPLLPLDHVLVGGGVGVDTVDTVVLPGSDHRGLIVTLEVPRLASASRGG